MPTNFFYLGDEEVARLDDGTRGMSLGDLKKEAISGIIPNGSVRTRIGSEEDGHFWEFQFVDNEPVKDSIRIYDSQGSLAEGLYIENGKLNGILKGYDKRTKATTEQYYKDGRDVETKLYREDSSLVAHSISNYDKDEFVMKWYDKEENLTSETISKISDPRGDQLTKTYDKNGNIVSEEVINIEASLQEMKELMK